MAVTENEWSFFDVESVDPDTGTLTVLGNDDLIAGNLEPTCLVHHPTFDERAKLAALSDLADRMLAGDATAVGHAILRIDPTRFLPGHGPADGTFIGDSQHILRLGTPPRSQLRAHPKTTGHRQDLHRSPADPFHRDPGRTHRRHRE